MALALEVEVAVDAPPERVFARATDLEQFGAWMHGFVRCERLAGGPLGVGARWREVRRVFGREAAEEFEVVAWDPPRGFELFVDGAKGASGRGEYRFRHRFEPLAGGERTRLLLSGTISGMGCGGLVFGPLGKLVMRRAIQRDLSAFKAWVEGQE